MKRAILFILLGVVLGGSTVWLARHGVIAKPGSEESAETKPVEEEEPKTTITHDKNGNVVINMSDEMQGDAGIVVGTPKAAQFAPELKAYGHVLDPTPIAAMLSELDSALAARISSSSELAILRTLSAQGNASPRTLQAAEATALRDDIAVRSVRDRLLLTWGEAIAGRSDLSNFARSLTAQEAALIRLDVPAGEKQSLTLTTARLVTLAGDSTDAEFLGAAANVDPQFQGEGFLFLVKPNSLRLKPGQGIQGFLRLPGEPLKGVIVPREAIVRTEGKGWVYVLNEGGESLTRKEIALDRPTGSGWFVTGAVTAGDHVVIVGTQTLLSEELKATIQAD